MQAILMRNLLGAALIVGVLYGAYYFIDRNGYQRCKTEQGDADKAEAIKQANKIKEAAEQHDNDQATINALAHDLDKRLRVHIPVCPTSSQGDQDGGSGIFSEKVDAAFGRLQSGVDSLVKRCDEINISAIEANHSR